MSEDTFDPTTLGIIDESEPDDAEEVDADYSREDEAEEAESPSTDDADADTPDEEDDPEGEDSAEESDEGPDEDTPADDEDGEGGKSGPIEFAGRVWNSMEAIEQSFKSWEGRISVAEEKSRDYENRLADYYEYVQKVGKENDTLRARFEGTAEAAEGDTAATPPQTHEVDLDRVLRLAKYAAETRGIDPMEAAIKVYDQAQKESINARFAEMEAKVSAPIEEAETAQTIARAEQDLFTWAQELHGEDGDVRYPGLQKENLDSEFIDNVYTAWKQLANKFGAQYAYSEMAIEKAYSLAHDYAIESGKWTEDNPVAEPSTRKAQSRADFNADAEAASDLTGETPKMNRSRKSLGKQRLEELGAHAEVAINGGDPLGFYE